MRRQKNNKKLHFLITAGPTQESLDPVRYLSNHSSGKMGYALAKAALIKGHRVTLISGPTALTPPKKAVTIPVVSALEMFKAVMKTYRSADVIIKVAAVADYRPQTISKQKIKKSKDTLMLKLIKNPDILKTLGKKKKSGQLLVGFAAETHQDLAFGRAKLKEKKCDWIIVNNVGRKDIGFSSENNEVTLLSKNTSLHLNKMPKQRLANLIIQHLTQQATFK